MEASGCIQDIDNVSPTIKSESYDENTTSNVEFPIKSVVFADIKVDIGDVGQLDQKSPIEDANNPIQHKTAFTAIDLDPLALIPANLYSPFSCTICGERFFRESSLELHMQSHDVIYRFMCTICDDLFFEVNSFRAHMKIHSDELYKCNLCIENVVRKSKLDYHMRNHTTQLQRRVYAERVATSLALVDKKWISMKLEPYKCEKCNCQFVLKEWLMCHMQTHTVTTN